MFSSFYSSYFKKIIRISIKINRFIGSPFIGAVNSKKLSSSRHRLEITILGDKIIIKNERKNKTK
jgi:hypothetical protein